MRDGSRRSVGSSSLRVRCARLVLAQYLSAYRRRTPLRRPDLTPGLDALTSPRQRAAVVLRDGAATHAAGDRRPAWTARRSRSRTISRPPRTLWGARSTRSALIAPPTEDLLRRWGSARRRAASRRVRVVALAVRPGADRRRRRSWCRPWCCRGYPSRRGRRAVWHFNHEVRPADGWQVVARATHASGRAHRAGSARSERRPEEVRRHRPRCRRVRPPRDRAAGDHDPAGPERPSSLSMKRARPSWPGSTGPTPGAPFSAPPRTWTGPNCDPSPPGCASAGPRPGSPSPWTRCRPAIRSPGSPSTCGARRPRSRLGREVLQRGDVHIVLVAPLSGEDVPSRGDAESRSTGFPAVSSVAAIPACACSGTRGRCV